MNKGRFLVLDSFRGIAAIMVAAGHLRETTPETNFLNQQYLFHNTWLFVEFFFVLSGFVMTHSYIHKIQNSESFFLFIKKRFARIWPLHFFMTLMFIPLAIIANLGETAAFLEDRFSLFAFFTNTTLTQALGLHHQLTWNGVAWSISVEFYTYIVFGVFTLFFPKKHIIKVFLATSIISAIILYKHSSMFDTYDWAIFRCMYSFFLGCIAYKISTSTQSKALHEYLITITLLIALSMKVATGFYCYIFPPLFFVTIIVFSKESGRISNLLKKSYFQTLGKHSFSIYLTHSWVLASLKSFLFILQKWFGIHCLTFSEAGRTIDFGVWYLNELLVFPYLLIVIGISSFTFQYIEKPAQIYLTNWFLRKKERAAVAGTPGEGEA